MERTLKRCYILLFVGLIPWLTCKSSWAGWKPVEGNELPQVLAVVKSALVTNWEAMSRGWCQATVHQAVLQDSTIGPVELEVAWDKKCVGIIEYLYEQPLSNPPVPRSTPHMMICYTPTEKWVYSQETNEMFGEKVSSASRLRGDYDLRPQKIWLSVPGSNLSYLEVIHKIQEQGMRVSRDEGGRIRMASRGMNLEVDLNAGFMPVLFEVSMRQEELLEDEKKNIPLQFRYELDRDRHGVWYCKSAIMSRWPAGMQGEAVVRHFMAVHEYDSDPSAEKLHLDYQSMPIPPNTKVTSSIASHPGQWTYGKEREGRSTIEGAALRSLGEKMRMRGFSLSMAGSRLE